MKERSTRSRVRIQLSTLMENLDECCRKANIEFDEGKWSESQSNLDEHLSHHPALKDSVFRLYGDKLRRTLHKDGRFYDSSSLVVQRVHLLWTRVTGTPAAALGFVLRRCVLRRVHDRDRTIDACATGTRICQRNHLSKNTIRKRSG